ncbi:MAG: Re/Si-specific NAD(P)(+) transhydrogenase subunit alpha [Ignavibacteriae bacterium]|nr:Re/Si-specific NAD(P)(+) transhydrogenase subunit alpha [Ignavibacteriota bacterium]
MKLGILLESSELEPRVALIPEAIKQLRTLGIECLIEQGAGNRAGYSDDAFSEAGGEIMPSAADILSQVNILVKVNCPSIDQINALQEKTILIAPLNEWKNAQEVALLRERNIMSFALELIPRISRAQNMDILSSMASIAGYKAVLLAANFSGKFFPMMMTAAGTVAPSKVLVIGAGVAGLQAIATARRLGAIVEAFDVRPAVKEEVQSLGAKFIDIDLGETDTQTSGGYAKELSDNARQRQQAALAKHIAMADTVISTAAIPGKTAPRIITDAMVQSMKSGAVIIDLAAETGGNCELTKCGEIFRSNNGVLIVGPANLAATVPIHASAMFSKNVLNFIKLFIVKGEFTLNFEDEILAATCVTGR